MTLSDPTISPATKYNTVHTYRPNHWLNIVKHLSTSIEDCLSKLSFKEKLFKEIKESTAWYTDNLQ